MEKYSVTHHGCWHKIKRVDGMSLWVSYWEDVEDKFSPGFFKELIADANRGATLVEKKEGNDG